MIPNNVLTAIETGDRYGEALVIAIRALKAIMKASPTSPEGLIANKAAKEIIGIVG